MENIDLELINKAKKGDKASFNDLIARYSDDMYIIAQSKLKRRSDVEDAVQETMLEMFLDLKKLRNPEKFKPWMAKILVNNCYDIIRDNKEYDIRLDEDNIEDLESCYTFMDNSDAEFFNLIKFLDDKDRTILVMRFFLGYSQVEISKSLNMTANAVRMRSNRVKDKIRKELGI